MTTPLIATQAVCRDREEAVKMWPSLGNREPRFAIGTRFASSGKQPQVYTVRDILKTYNAAGELVRIRYVAGRTLMGQEVLDYDVLEFTVAKGCLDDARGNTGNRSGDRKEG